MLIRFFFFLIFISQAYAEKTCLLSEAMANPKLMSNESFWNEYSSLISSGKNSDETLKHLMQKHNATPSSVGPVKAAPTLQRSMATSLDKKAKKDIDHLPTHLREKFDEFLGEVTSPGGIKNLYMNPGKWHYEKLKKNGQHTVRLNNGYRVLFDVKDDKLIILQVNREAIHNI